MPDATNMFMLRGKLSGPAQLETITTRNGSFNKATFILEHDIVTESSGNSRSFTQHIKCVATSYNVDPQAIANIPVGSTVVVGGKLMGRKNEYNGKVNYYNDLDVRQIGYGTEEEVPF